MSFEPRVLERQQATGNRQQATGNRQQAKGKRQKAKGNGQWATGNGQRATDKLIDKMIIDCIPHDHGDIFYA